MEFHPKGLEPAVEEFPSGALIVKTKLPAGIGRRFLGITRAFTNSLMRSRNASPPTAHTPVATARVRLDHPSCWSTCPVRALADPLRSGAERPIFLAGTTTINTCTNARTDSFWTPRSEPRVKKRRPKNYRLLTKPRPKMKLTQHRNRWKAKSPNTALS